MTLPISQSIARTFLTVSILTFLFVGFLCLVHINMSMSSDMPMFHCPIMGENTTALCQTHSFEHITAWQNIFSVLPAKESNVQLGLFGFFLLFLYIARLWGKISYTSKVYCQALLFRFSKAVTFICRDPLQEAFSSGILHAKVF